MDRIFNNHKRRKRRRRPRMEAKVAVPETEFDVAAFEKRLQTLKDSQDSINNCCHWCLENRMHHKKIVSSWLNVLKRVKVEQRVTLFYLANDVIQYSKRRNYDFVESWGTTLQKATTMVRDERVKHKVLRIFKIWEQRGIYNEEFIADLSGLISASPAKKSDDPHEFQATYLINKIKQCTKLENETDSKLTKLKEHNPKIQIEKAENLCSSLKDRAHVDDVEKEIDEYAQHIEEYVDALKAEIKARTNLISLLVQADTQLESDRKDVKLVANAYKAFGTRVKNVKKKLDEMLPTLSSPIPSPDVNAPSPSPDSDLELPDTTSTVGIASESATVTATASLPTQVQSAGYYNQLPITSTDSKNFSNNNNNFMNFLNSSIAFSLQNFAFANANPTITSNATSNATQTTNSYNLNNSLSSFFQALVQPPPPPEAVPPVVTTAANIIPNYKPPPVVSTTNFPVTVPPPPPPVTATGAGGYQYGGGGGGVSNHMPLLPPPMPPFGKDGGAGYGGGGAAYGAVRTPSTGYGAETTINTDDYQSPFDNPPPPPYDPAAAGITTYQQQQQQSSSSSSVEIVYNDDTTTASDQFSNTLDVNNHQWNHHQHHHSSSWDATDTPESPPHFEKQSYSEPPIEYHDTMGMGLNHGGVGAADVDHRILRQVPMVAPVGIDLMDEMSGSRGCGDVDHRNLISLTGSPGECSGAAAAVAPVTESNNGWGAQKDKDYRISHHQAADQDYRIPPPFDLEQLKLPPPPPPPNNTQNIPLKPNNSNLKPGLSPRKLQDNVESIDMDLSDDDLQHNQQQQQQPPPIINNNESMRGFVENQRGDMMMPPPPFPEIPDDVDANNLLDDLANDLNSGEFGGEGGMPMDDGVVYQENHPHWMQQPPPQQHNNWMETQLPPPPPQPQPQFHHQDFNSFRGRGGNVKHGGNWGGQRGGGRGRGFPPPPFRGGGRGARGNGGRFSRGRGRGGGFRGNFRGGFIN